MTSKGHSHLNHSVTTGLHGHANSSCVELSNSFTAPTHIAGMGKDHMVPHGQSGYH